MTTAPVCAVVAGTSYIGFDQSLWVSANPKYYVADATSNYVYRTGLANKYNYAAMLARVRSAVNPAVIGSVNLGDSPVGWTSASGAYWAWVQGPVSITGGTITNSKLILLVDGAVTISGNITVGTWNTGSVVIISGGNITLGSGVTRLDGIYMTDGRFVTGSGGPLTVNGSVTAWTDFTLSRSAVDNSVDPAEIFNFVPDFVVNLPAPVQRRHIIQELENP